MTIKNIHIDQKVLVVGAGVSGMAACRLLKSKGCKVRLTDGKARERQAEADLVWLDENNIEQEFGGHADESFLKAGLIVVSPGVPLDIGPLNKARAQGITIIGELELGSWFFKGEIIAITGTNGKTTVTSMIGDGLSLAGRSVFIGGNIGTPLSAHVLSEKQAEVAVLEVSSFQLDSMACFKPKVALLLNISPDHLDRYKDYAAYVDSKMSIFAKQTNKDVAILCGTDEKIMARKDQLQGAIVLFDDEHWHIDQRHGCLVWREKDEAYTLRGLQMKRPNVQNCMAAISGCRVMGASKDVVQQMLRHFEIPAHRLTGIGTYNGVEFVDDSKATNIGAVQAALAGFSRPVVLIAGGRGKGGDYSMLCAEMGRIVKALILIGEAASEMQTAFAGVTHVVMADDMDDAVGQAVAVAREGDVVLLSPACASFDMYTGYAQRGEVFTRAVQRNMSVGGSLQNGMAPKIMRQAV